MIPPILEVFVVWHPDDTAGRRVARVLLEHFHGTAFSGLVGGAVEVYTRSAPWEDDSGPPRPMTFSAGGLPNGLQPAAVTVVVPVLGVNLARAAVDDDRWRRYLEEIAYATFGDERVAVFHLAVDDGAFSIGSPLIDLFGAQQSLNKAGAHDDGVLCRDLCQAIAGFVDDAPERALRVFVSHTKRYSPAEVADAVAGLVNDVRTVIAATHLMEFFDESDLLPGTSWQEALIKAAGTSALLVVRTDLYASREWCQNEVFTAKTADMPIVVLQALHKGEERGSFLTDHVSSVALSRSASSEVQRASIIEALNKLVDEALKRSLWRQQRGRLGGYGFDWLPANAPEPITLARWIRDNPSRLEAGTPMFVMHPDPPLGSAELEAIGDVVALARAGKPLDFEILTPRTFASRGGRTPE